MARRLTIRLHSRRLTDGDYKASLIVSQGIRDFSPMTVWCVYCKTPHPSTPPPLPGSQFPPHPPSLKFVRNSASSIVHKGLGIIWFEFVAPVTVCIDTEGEQLTLFKNFLAGSG